MITPPPGDEQPRYLQIAAILGRQISKGALTPGTRLPSEAELARTYGAGRPTVRQALDELRRIGLVMTSAGRGTYIRHQPAMRLRSSDRYRRKPGATSPFARDAQREGRQADWSWSTSRIRATNEIAGQLGIEAGEDVVQTVYLYRADGAPTQTSTSWEPWSLIGGTPIEDPEGEGQISGVVARMDAIGVRITEVTESVVSRPPTVDDQHTLQITGDTWVHQIDRQHWAGDHVVEAAVIIIPADRYRLAYRIPVN